jgi:hypothetical protein
MRVLLERASEKTAWIMALPPEGPRGFSKPAARPEGKGRDVFWTLLPQTKEFWLHVGTPGTIVSSRASVLAKGVQAILCLAKIWIEREDQP